MIAAFSVSAFTSTITDDLSNPRVDFSQPSAKFYDGRATIIDRSAGSQLVSVVIASPGQNISSARISAIGYVPNGTSIKFYLSNDNGINWIQANTDTDITFTRAGQDLRWKAFLTRQYSFSEAPYLDSVTVTYTTGNTTAGAISGGTGSGSSSGSSSGSGTIGGSTSGTGGSTSGTSGSTSGTNTGSGTISGGTSGTSKTSGTSGTSTSTSGSKTSTSSSTASSSSSSGGFFSFLFGGSSSKGKGTLFGAMITKAYTNNPITLVRVPDANTISGQITLADKVYEIINGKKHLIPTADIFFDYKFKAETIQSITQEQLDKYRQVKTFRISGDKTGQIYYLTQGSMTRKVINKEVMDSYGDRTEDIIDISKKEFNFYPENQFIYLERPFTGDVYQITNGTKRFLTPMAVKRMNIKESQVAPVNQTEFDSYKTGDPVIF
jgi:hypothetical protein